MSLKAKNHIKTIGKLLIITPNGARQLFGMLIFVHEMTYTLLPDHLTPLPCLLSHMNWLPHPCLILYNPYHAYAPAPPWPLSPTLTTYHANTPTAPSRYASDATLTPFYASSHLPSLHSCRALKICI
ncbi:hypothetical protein O181_057523 [Austropuccinia psidii MF-1]|uniref:Uncharacterized protein n=1 Tax=Austropuccinia psidii MF-1 TaxID=1389203 RepID=A0A9Q3HUK6_9BASI|nr:hypothetical protein [Austropuccinia psidii MF-1]